MDSSGSCQNYNNYININNSNNYARFIESRSDIASEELADRSIQLARNTREKICFKSSFR